uniref:Uncharacterized protein n=1 Tax=Helianthus annuus TaxID=4232 RepID=A0A251SER4_HELAN
MAVGSLDTYGACTGRSRSLWSMDYVLKLIELMLHVWVFVFMLPLYFETKIMF